MKTTKSKAWKERQDNARVKMVPVGQRGRSRVSGWECTVLEHVERFEDGLQHKVRWDQNGVIGYVRPDALIRIDPPSD